jgi:twitching motility protein PilT
MPALDRFFQVIYERKASDLHLSAGKPPLMRLNGKIQALIDGHPPLGVDELEAMLFEIAPEPSKKEFIETNDADFAYEFGSAARFRCNLFRDRTGAGGVFRQIPKDIITAEKLGLSRAILDLCYLSKGLVVVTGPTGSGKSTTLCAMVDYINRNRDEHIITIEDPIEFVHENKRCLVNQREINTHTGSFKRALRAALREDPNIILVGEMRDLETVAIAIEMAETGHLVFGTLHTTTAASTVDRIIDQFPSEQQAQIRTMLAESLKGVVAQTLLRKKDGNGRVAALEVLIVTPSVAANIREGKTHQIPLAMQTGRKLGMVELNFALMKHVEDGIVTAEEAYSKAVDRASLAKDFERVGIPFKPPTEEAAAAAPAAGAKPGAPAAAAPGPAARPQAAGAPGAPAKPAAPAARMASQPPPPPEKKSWFS